MSSPKSPAPKPPAKSDTDTPGGGALERARQFARSRGLPMPPVECAPPAPAKKKKKTPAASSHTKKTKAPPPR
jgi:hypothetical protein